MRVSSLVWLGLVVAFAGSCSGSSFSSGGDHDDGAGEGGQSDPAEGGRGEPGEGGDGNGFAPSGGRSDGGDAGTAGAPAAGGAGTAAGGASGTSSTDDGGSSGAGMGGGGSEPDCATSDCDANATCAIKSGQPTCACNPGFQGDGHDCKRFASCAELHAAQPTLPSGTYRILPALASAEFDVYCDMTTSGGGWTLVLNQGTSFDPQTAGGDTGVCFSSNCVTRAYSTLLVGSGIMLDMKDGDIVGDGFKVRAIVAAVDAASRGKTLKSLFTSGPSFFEADDNSNLELHSPDADYCSSDSIVGNMRDILCGTPVLTFADHIFSCPFPDVTHAIGIRKSRAEEWNNCAGWPSQPNYGDNWLLDNVRAWVR